MIVYHGGAAAIPHPDLLHSRKAVDFGAGFYVTPLHEQASYSEAWLDFIVACRSERDKTDWDIVVGGIANDRVFDTLEAFFDGFASREQTIAKLKVETPNLQICFRTEAALKTLTFMGSEAT